MAIPANKRNTLTPFLLAKAMIWPFLLVPGGAAVMLGLAAATVGLNPAQFMADFLADSAVVLSPLALKCAGIWAIYTAFYVLLTWAYWPHYRSAFDYDRLNPGLIRFFHPVDNHPLHKLQSAMDGLQAFLLRRSVWQGIGFAWAGGTHPKIE